MEEIKKVINNTQIDKKVETPKKPTYKELEQSISEYQQAMELAKTAIKNSTDNYKEVNDKYLRALADYQNLKKRTEIEISKAKDLGKIVVLEKLITVMDDFDKAKAYGQVTEDGIEIIYNELLQVFAVLGVEIINPKRGEPFDDSLHEAIHAIPITNDKQIKNTIYSVHQKGYKMGDTMIRYAKVGVYV